MSKIDELLKNEKVEWKRLWEVTIWDKKFNGVDRFKQKKINKFHYYLSSELKNLASEDGTVKILTTNITELYAIEEQVKNNVSQGEVVCIPWGGNPIVQYYKGKFITGDNRIATSFDKNILNNKYLYYILLSKIQLIASFYRGAGIKHPDMAKVLDMEIPIPSIAVQEEIVKTLDRFTNYATELQVGLQAELQARIKQYEYYRDMLLSEENFKKMSHGITESDDKVKVTTLGEIVDIVVGGDVPKNNFSVIPTDEYKIPIFSNGTEKNALYGYTNVAKVDKKSVTVSARGTIGYVSYKESPYFPIVRLLCLIPKKNIKAKYLFYLLQNSKISHKATGIPSLTSDMIKSKIVLIPPIEIQNKIVDVLDKFQSLLSDTKGLLPKEIELRQKQYEYYREKLLDFKK